MEPLLKEGDFVGASMVPYFFCSPRKGQLVICRHPGNGRMLIKRIARKENANYWVEGANANQSTDSRDFGWLQKKHIEGRVLFVARYPERRDGESASIFKKEFGPDKVIKRSRRSYLLEV